MSDNGRWQLAFWLMTVVSGTWLIGLTTGAIANDRLRASEDQQIREEVRDLLISNERSHSQIKVDLAKIKTVLGVKGE